jgi:hypothetical protein
MNSNLRNQFIIDKININNVGSQNTLQNHNHINLDDVE